MFSAGHGELGANSPAQRNPSICSLKHSTLHYLAPRSLKAKEVDWRSQAAEILITQSQPEHWAPYPRSKGIGAGGMDGWMLVGSGEVVELSRRAGLGLGCGPSWVSHPAGWEQAGGREGREAGRPGAGRMGRV